jgi:hypothetical protein
LQLQPQPACSSTSTQARPFQTSVLDGVARCNPVRAGLWAPSEWSFRPSSPRTARTYLPSKKQSVAGQDARVEEESDYNLLFLAFHHSDWATSPSPDSYSPSPRKSKHQSGLSLPLPSHAPPCVRRPARLAVARTTHYWEGLSRSMLMEIKCRT